jgi:hypothetical protein
MLITHADITQISLSDSLEAYKSSTPFYRAASILAYGFAVLQIERINLPIPNIADSTLPHNGPSRTECIQRVRVPNSQVLHVASKNNDRWFKIITNPKRDIVTEHDH